MKDKIKRLRLNFTLGSVLVIIMGLIFVFNPVTILEGMASFVGFVLLLIGITQFLGRLFSPVNHSAGMLVGAVIAAVGAWILIRPDIAASIVPIIVGVILVAHGISNISLAFEGRKYNMGKWGMHVLAGLLTVLGGALCIANAFGIVSFAMQVIGIILVYDGVASIVGFARFRNYEKQVIDAEYRELD